VVGEALIQILNFWLGLFFVLAGGYGVYFAYVKFRAAKPWGLKIGEDFLPAVTILVPVHNEKGVIELKLENIAEVSYPKEKMEVVVADDASTDGTLAKVYEFKRRHSELNIKVVEQNPRVGKARVLNAALPVCANDVIVVSDADCFWHLDILRKALPYLSDPTVGAVTGSGIIENPDGSWVTRGEANYLGLSGLLRLGESKIHSTIRFEGGFCAYKRGAFKEFDCESGSDDSGTALYVVQNGFRTIFVPEARFMTKFPRDLKGKIRVKVRRANQLIWLWIKCLRLLLKRRLLLPKRIAISDMFLFVVNPVVFFALLLVTLVTAFVYPAFFIPLVIVLSLVCLVPTVRSYLVEVMLNNSILFYALVSCVRGKKFVAWEKS